MMLRREGNRFLLEGPATLQTAGGLLAGSAAMHATDAVVDFGGVTAADSSALSLVLEWVRRSRAAGKSIAFANLGGNLRSLAELYGVLDLIPFAA